MLRINNLTCGYGGADVLHGVSLEIGEGEIVSLLGANGAGKSTTLRAISGQLRIRAGSIEFMHKEIAGAEPYRVAGYGIAHIPEGRHVFGLMTVLENIELGGYLMRGRPEFRERMEYVFRLFPRLRDRHAQLAGTLSGGEQQMLAMGRGLMSCPKLLLLDEPSLGLAPIFVDRVAQALVEINQAGTTIMLVEQNAHVALEISSRSYVLERGTIVLSGKADDVANNEMVRKAYLGED